jgi:CPA2 family monovalent cation:H+ antiporter-2
LQFLAAAEVPPVFALLAIILIVVVGVSLMLARVQQSLLIGYFVCGVVVANSGVLAEYGGEAMEARIAQLADFGVTLLMFTLGLEFSLGEVRYLRRAAFGAGPLQVLLTLPVGVGLGLAAGVPWAGAVTLGVACAISSTAVGLKSLDDMGLGGSPGARFALGVAIFQDLVVIAFAVLLPVLYSAGRGEDVVVPAMLALAGKGLLFVGLAAVLGRWVIPRLLAGVARTRNGELFTLTVFGLCVGIAFLGGVLELSLALGAFVAGVTVSESIFRHRIMTEVRPLKDLFLSLFFVSVGLSIDLRLVAGLWWKIGLLTAGLLVVKSVVVVGVARRLGWPLRASVLAGLALASGSEFSLLLLHKADRLRAWPAVAGQVWLAAIALSMALVPVLLRHADRVVGWLERLGFGAARAEPPAEAKASERVKALRDHAIICGYGPVGRRLVEALDELGVASLVVELNADTVRTLHRSGRPVLFADATHHETWSLAGVENARLVAFTFSDSPVVATALPMLRERRGDVTVLARAKFGSDVTRLEKFGVDAVIHDEGVAAEAVVEAARGIYERAVR